MAEMVPDRMPHGASQGEKRLFSILQKAPDDYIVYYEPIIAGRYPDFVVICPDLGLTVIEVKGWYPREIQEANDNDVRILDRNGQIRAEKHPQRQARDYMFGLMELCTRQQGFEILLNASGEARKPVRLSF